MDIQSYMRVSWSFLKDRKTNNIAAFLANDTGGKIRINNKDVDTGDYILVDISDKKIRYNEPLAFVLDDICHICVLKKVSDNCIWVGKPNNGKTPLMVVSNEEEVKQFLFGTPFELLKMPKKINKRTKKHLLKR